MTIGLISITALGLSMDACAVASSRGLAAGRVYWAQAAGMGAVFGGFQGVMPCIGYALGEGARPIIEPFDHWVALVLLAGVGAKMLWDARASAGEMTERSWPDARGLVLLGVATSVDALAAGLTLSTLEVPLALAALVIALTTFVLVTPCALLGHRLGTRFGRWSDRIGGILLITLGVWIAFDHVVRGA